jgi:hypothetical protein
MQHVIMSVVVKSNRSLTVDLVVKHYIGVYCLSEYATYLRLCNECVPRT